MARFGQGLIQALTNPSYQQGMFNLGSAIGSAPAQRRDQQAKSTAMTMVNEALASQDPDKLLQAANAIKTMDPATATKLSQAAGQLRAKSQETGIGRQLQSGLNAITSAARRGVPFEDLTKLQDSVVKFGGTNEQINAAYKRGIQEKPSEADRYKVVGNNIFDVQTGDYIEPSVAGDKLSVSQLKDVATPDSILEYAKTGDVNVLKPLEQTEEEEGPTATELANKLAVADNTITTVKEAAGLSKEIYPLFYDITKYAPGTASRSLDNRIETLKANLSFDRLQQMRDESKTGGALGQVSNIELRLLGSTVASLDPTQPDFTKQLKKVEESYSRFKNALLGKAPPGDKYIEDNGVLYYEDDEGNFINLGALQ